MLGYMEVVCLILGPMLASQPCSHAFWVLSSLQHFIENVFYYSCPIGCLFNCLFLSICINPL